MNDSPPETKQPDAAFKIVPGPADDSNTSPVGATDTKAQKEAISIASGTLEDDAKRQEHGRTQALKNHVHRAIVAAVWIIFGIFMICVVTLAWHQLMPIRYAWLSAEQQSAVKTFVFSSAITSAAGSYVAKRIE